MSSLRYFSGPTNAGPMDVNQYAFKMGSCYLKQWLPEYFKAFRKLKISESLELPSIHLLIAAVPFCSDAAQPPLRCGARGPTCLQHEHITGAQHKPPA